MSPGKLQGCRRGLFGLSSWDPLPRPLEWQSSANDQPNGESPQNIANDDRSEPVKSRTYDGNLTKKRMVAKYNYKGNPDSPLGKELSVTQTEKLWFLEDQSINPHWCLAENESGEKGFVPKSYMMFLEDKVGGLPWLQQKSPAAAAGGDGDAVKQEPAETAFGMPSTATKPHVKPYKSTYDHPDLQKKNSEYYCEVCDKQLNGPRPYQAHMASKGHKEALEYIDDNS